MATITDHENRELKEANGSGKPRRRRKDRSGSRSIAARRDAGTSVDFGGDPVDGRVQGLGRRRRDHDPGRSPIPVKDRRAAVSGGGWEVGPPGVVEEGSLDRRVDIGRDDRSAAPTGCRARTADDCADALRGIRRPGRHAPDVGPARAVNLVGRSCVHEADRADVGVRARMESLDRRPPDRHPMVRPARRQPAARQAVTGREQDEGASLGVPGDEAGRTRPARVRDLEPALDRRAAVSSATGRLMPLPPLSERSVQR